MGPLPVFSIENSQISQSHSFVANVAKQVSPSVVRIDIERDIQAEEFESDGTQVAWLLEKHDDPKKFVGKPSIANAILDRL